MTMKRFIRKDGPTFVDPIPAAVMDAQQRHKSDPLGAHYCVVQDKDGCSVLRHLSREWRVMYSTRHEEEKKISLRKKYH